jgi:pimeloyl-ACP methyl ester carboxylesterase
MSRLAVKGMMRIAPNARFKDIGGAGHFLMLGKPAEVAGEILGFLEEVSL